MSVILAGLLLGGASTGVTYLFSTDLPLALIAGTAAAVLTWLGCAFLIFLDD